MNKLEFTFKNDTDFDHIDFVVVENPVLDKTSLRKDFHNYYKRYNIQNHINISNIENYVDGSEKDFIVLFFEGILFDFVNPSELFYYMQEEINSETEEWIIKGNIIDNYESILCYSPHRNPKKESKYFSMYPLMLILNTKKVQSLQIKDYGRDGDKINVDLVNVETSSDMMHDNYTPKWIKKSKQKSII